VLGKEQYSFSYAPKYLLATADSSQIGVKDIPFLSLPLAPSFTSLLQYDFP